MLPILAGVATALFFATSALSSARASRRAGSGPAVAGVMIVGIILLAPIALIATPLPASPAVRPESFVWAAVGGAANVGGLLLIYRALRIGAVGIVSTIASTEGALAAVISVLAGQTLAPGSGLALAVIAIGVVLAASGGGHEVEEGVVIDRARSLRAAGFAAVAATVFGIGLFTIGHASATLPATWIVLIGRVVGVVGVGVPLLVTGRLRLPRATWPYILVTGCAEVGGYSLYAIGAHEDIALTAVLASMFAPLAAVAAFVLFRERLAPRQIAGIALAVVGIAILGVVTA
jgi:drug/metabolite transporter (DMT)-like permease